VAGRPSWGGVGGDCVRPGTVRSRSRACGPPRPPGGAPARGPARLGAAVSGGDRRPAGACRRHGPATAGAVRWSPAGAVRRSRGGLARSSHLADLFLPP